MSETPPQSDLMNLAHLARHSVGLIARPLFDYQDRKHLTDEQLAFIVGVPVERLPYLALCEWPHSEEQLAAIATYLGATSSKLAAWLEVIEP